jgi:molybdopterin/thiamine biosynthesis adenylyltransferase
MSIFSDSKMAKSYKSKRLKPRHPLEAPVTGRQELIKGFHQKKLEASNVILVGAGGINSEIGEGLVRKGVGRISILDDDLVELSNLNRQFFFVEDLDKPKAFRLAKNLAENGFVGSEITGYKMTFQDATNAEVELSAAVVVCGVDNDQSRILVAQYYYELGIPVVFLGTSLDGNQGYIFVQESGQACFSCVFPNSKLDEDTQIRCAPSSKDILKVIAGFALKAIDSLVMWRMVRKWNFRRVVLNGIENDQTLWVERRSKCPICGVL